MEPLHSDQNSQPENPSDQEIGSLITHVVIGVMHCSCGAGLSHAHKRQREEQLAVPLANMDFGLFIDGQAQALRSLSHSFLDGDGQAEHDDLEEDEAAIKKTVEPLNRVGLPELIVRPDNESAMRAFRDAVAFELRETFGCQSNCTGSTTIQFGVC